MREFWAHFDAKDFVALLAMMTEDAIETYDLAKGWLRGHAAIGEHFARIGRRSEDSHTLLEDVKVTETSQTAAVNLCGPLPDAVGRPAGIGQGADDDDLRPRGRSVENRAAPHEVGGRARAPGGTTRGGRAAPHDDPCSGVAAGGAVS